MRKMTEKGRCDKMREQILVVDDEVEIADLIALYLRNDGFEVTVCHSGGEALAALEKQVPDLAILDVMLPDMSGFDILKKLREQYFFPVIMLTARVADMDKITGLMIGADDYMTKPFNPLELVARVKTQLRRAVRYNQAREKEQQEETEVNGLYINKTEHLATLYGQPLRLTPIEFHILWYLCTHRGKVVSSEELFEAVWGEKYLDSNNTVMAHIARLREKMKDSSRHPKFIKTVWGVGYQIE